ncbi:MAG: hypothetical protein ABJP45_15570 [Cyclobacteriaceae bacterium]
MKNLTTIALLLSLQFGFGQPMNRSFENANGTIKLLGQVTLDRLKSDPFDEWYQTNYVEHSLDQKTLETIDLSDSITIFMGTWCGDSRREVPRFIKMLESESFDFAKLKIVCLNSGFQNYKQAPEREERGANVHRVPTFVFHESDGTEIGRVVEEPVVSLEADTKVILDGGEYKTFYPVVADLLKKFESHSIKEVRKMIPKLLDDYREEIVNEYELNTYGYVLWTSFDLMKAEFIFELNTELFPDLAMPFQSLARFKQVMGMKKDALVSAKKGMKIDPENETLARLIAELD